MISELYASVVYLRLDFLTELDIHRRYHAMGTLLKVGLVRLQRTLPKLRLTLHTAFVKS